MDEQNKTNTSVQAEGENDLANDLPLAQGQTGQNQQQQGRVYTEEEFNRHMAALRKKLEAEVKRAADEAAARAKMDEAERLKAEKADLEKLLQEREATAKRAEAKLELLRHGADPEKIDRALRVYLAEVDEVGEDKAPSFEDFLKQWPEFKAATSRPEPTSGAAGAGNNKPLATNTSEALRRYYERR